MAPKGGPREPRGGPRVSGVGRFSERSDGQTVVAPPVHASPPSEMPTGSGQELTEAQRAVPLAHKGGGGGGNRPQRAPLPAGGSDKLGGLPPWLLERDSSKPDQPITAGMDMGAGPGSEVLRNNPEPQDDNEAILAYLVARGYQSIAPLLREYRQPLMMADDEEGVSIAAPEGIEGLPVPGEPVGPGGGGDGGLPPLGSDMEVAPDLAPEAEPGADLMEA